LHFRRIGADNCGDREGTDEHDSLARPDLRAYLLQPGRRQLTQADEVLQQHDSDFQ
jgi:hypothetical protein